MKKLKKQDRLSAEEKMLLSLLADAITDYNAYDIDIQIKKTEGPPVQEKSYADEIDWKVLIKMADEHAVIPLIYDKFSVFQGISEELLSYSSNKARLTVLQSHRLLYRSAAIGELFRNEGIRAVLLKGAYIGSMYPSAELRKSGDIDFLIADQEEFDKACELLKKSGYEPEEEQLATHHIVFSSKEGIKIEPHSMLAEPFDDQTVNEYLEKLKTQYNDNIYEAEIMGYKIPVVSDAYYAYHLLLHMLQHFLRAGFGLKLLCDWVVFWNRTTDERERALFIKLTKESGLYLFASMITSLCVKYLGLKKENADQLFEDLYDVPDDSMIKEIIEAQEFGHSESDRMVVVRKNGFCGYLAEFHHQMLLNNPKQSKIVLFWPFLWARTLVVFIYNNHKIRKTSLVSIFRVTGKRSRLISDMKLFKMEQEKKG